MVLHVGLDRPSKTPNLANKDQNVLIWGGGSSFGFFAVQIAVQVCFCLKVLVFVTTHFGIAATFGDGFNYYPQLARSWEELFHPSANILIPIP